MGKIPFARGFHRCLLIVGLNKLALGWRHEYFSEHRLSSFLFPLSCSFSSNLPQRGQRKAWYNMANQATESWEWFVNWIWEADSRHPVRKFWGLERGFLDPQIMKLRRPPQPNLFPRVTSVTRPLLCHCTSLALSDTSFKKIIRI